MGDVDGMGTLQAMSSILMYNQGVTCNNPCLQSLGRQIHSTGLIAWRANADLMAIQSRPEDSRNQRLPLPSAFKASAAASTERPEESTV